MKQFYKIFAIIFISICLLLLVHHINEKLDVAKIPSKYLVSQVAETKIAHLNFDENNSVAIVPLLTDEQKYSGNNSLKISPNVEFVDIFEYYLPEKNQNEYLNSIRLDLLVFAKMKFEEVVIVIEITDFTGKIVQWKNLRINPSTTNVWEHIYYSVYLNNEARKPQNKVKIFLWNLTKEDFYVDDFRVAVRRSDTEPVSRNDFPLNTFTQELSAAQKNIYGHMLQVDNLGKYHLHISKEDMFSPPYTIDFEQVSASILPSKIYVNFTYSPLQLHENIKMAIEFRNKVTQTKAFFYYQLPNYYEKGKKERCSFDVPVPEEYRYNGEMISYFWNTGGNELNVQEIKYVFF